MWQILSGGLVAVLLPLLPAQTPDAAAAPATNVLDLAAVASALDPGDCPDVLRAVPAPLVAASNERLASASVDELDRCLRLGRADAPARLAAALAVLGQGDDERRTAAGLLREVRAGALLSSFHNRQDRVRQMFGGPAEAGWLAEASPLGQRRSRALAARLLREHPGAPEVGPLLMLVRNEVPGFAPSRLAAAAVMTLGPAATSLHHLQLAIERCADLDFAGAAAAVAAADAAPRPGPASEHAAARTMRFELAERLARIEALAVDAAAPGLAGQIGHLRILQLANPQQALAESRRLVAAGAEHALPFAILASAAAFEDRAKADEVPALLARAATLPGRDLLYVSVQLVTQILPKLRRGDLTDERREQVLTEVKAVLLEGDRLLADDPTPEARFYCWLREELAWCEPDVMAAIADVLPAARERQAAAPGSPDAYRVLLAAAMFSSDAAAARDALLQPLAGALATLPTVNLDRATVFVARALRADRLPDPKDLDRLLGDLERAEGDARNAAYLRGVCAWWQATRPDADAAAKRAARQHLAAAQRPVGEPGHWRAASALAVVDGSLGNAPDLGTLSRLRQSDPWLHAQDTELPLLGLAALTGDPDVVAAVEQRAQAIDHSGTLAVLNAALAARHADAGDAEAARRAARRALQALANASPTDLRHDRGVVTTGEFRHGLLFKLARPEIQLDFAIDLWLVPVVPSRDQLKQVADGK